VSDGFWGWWVGGIVVGTLAVLVPLTTGRALGVSSLYATLFSKRSEDEVSLAELERALLTETEAEFGALPLSDSKPSFRDRLAALRAEAEKFRPLFLVGMLGGALLTAALSGKFGPMASLGKSFDLRYGALGPIPIAALLISGVFIGFGTRVAGGCTSGHGISGVARVARGSLLSTVTFWGTGLLVTWIFAWLGSR
jgi:uncharacterized membrane protein YedE/YeeE